MSSLTESTTGVRDETHKQRAVPFAVAVDCIRHLGWSVLHQAFRRALRSSAAKAEAESGVAGVLSDSSRERSRGSSAAEGSKSLLWPSEQASDL